MHAPSSIDLASIDLAQRLALLLALGFFLGLAFEETYKRTDRSLPGGVRTCPALGLAGAMLYLVEPRYTLAFTAGLVGLAGWLFAFLDGQLKQPATPAAPMMAPVTNLLAYGLGPIALTQPAWVSVGMTVSTVLLLGTRDQLHRVARRVPSAEILTAGKFLVLVGIVLPLAPRMPVTAWTPLSPYQVALAVVAICTLSYAAYLVQRYVAFGHRALALAPALLGGLYSSTATTVVLAKRLGTAGRASRDLTSGIVLATAVMYLRLDAVVALFNWRLAVALSPVMGGLFGCGALIAFWAWRSGTAAAPDQATVSTDNPLQLPTALLFAVLFVAVSVASKWVEAQLGQVGVFGLAAMVGLTDIDPFVLSLAQGGIAGMTISALCAAVLIAASANNLMKAGYALSFGGVKAARIPSLALVALAALGFVAAAWYYSVG